MIIGTLHFLTQCNFYMNVESEAIFLPSYFNETESESIESTYVGFMAANYGHQEEQNVYK